MNAAHPARMLAIGELAHRTGLAVSAIRYYEEIGLVPKATRRASGHRVYAPDAEKLLLLIRRCRDFGFSLEDTKALTALASNMQRDCVEARDIAQVHLDAVRAKLAELLALQHSLEGFVQACNAQCAGGPAARCTIFRDLANGGASPSAPAGSDPHTRKGCCG